MNKAYVSEFTDFMNRFLAGHPDVVEEQRRDWDFFWNPKVDPTPPDITKENRVPDDSYGFSWSAWHAESQGVKKPGSSGAAK